MQQLDRMLTGILRADMNDSPDDDDTPPDDLAGLYYPLEYVIQTWQEKRNNHILPDPGGLNDQDWRLVLHDWPVVNERYNYLQRMLYPKEGGGGLQTSEVDLAKEQGSDIRDML